VDIVIINFFSRRRNKRINYWWHPEERSVWVLCSKHRWRRTPVSGKYYG